MSGKVHLFDDSDKESDTELKINKEYANKYDQWREKELLQRYKDLQDEVSTSSSSESDQEAPEFDESFFRVLSLLKGKDPKIYEKNFVAFKETAPETKPKLKKTKPLSIKDYERQIVLEKEGDISDEEHVEAKSTNEEELAQLKRVIMEDDESENEDCIKSLTPLDNVKSDEPDGVIKYLKGGEADIPDDSKKDLSYLRNCWNDPNLDNDEKFLRDFFLNKAYLEKDDEFKVVEELEKLSEEEKIEEEQEQFEHKYNFRFEEPDPEFIKRYPRTVGDSLRRKDSKRKEKREDYSERKQREKEQKREELKRLKALKRKEIEDKFFKLQEITGRDNINFDEIDIESDFDPDKHDQKMKELFNEEFYSVEEEQKPVFEYDEEIDEVDWNHWSRSENQDIKEEISEEAEEEYPQESFDDHKINARMQFEQEMIDSTQNRKKKGKKKSLFAKILSNPKPLYDPEGKSYDEYLEDYYKMDYEDVIGDMPVRFKYRKVVPNSFGLTVDEILKADDKDLNRWCSLKKTHQYREESEELYDVKAFERKAEQFHLKEKFLPSLYAEPNEEEKLKVTDGSAEDSKRKKRRKKKKKADSNLSSDVKNEQNNFKLGEFSTIEEIKDSQEPTKSEVHSIDSLNTSKKKKKKSKNKLSINDDVSISVKEESSDISVNKSISVQDNTDIINSVRVSKRKRPKRRNKKRENLATNATTVEQVMNSSGNINDISENKSVIHKQANRRLSEFESMSIDISSMQNNVKPPKKKIKLEMENNNDKDKNQLGIKHTKYEQKTRWNKGNDFVNRSQVKKHFNSNMNDLSQIVKDKKLALSNERLAAYGINPKKFKNSLIYSNKNT